MLTSISSGSIVVPKHAHSDGSNLEQSLHLLSTNSKIEGTIPLSALRRLDLVSNLKEICRVYHADNHKDLDSALHAFTEVENEIHKFAGKEGVSLDDILTNIGLTRHGEA